MIGMPYKPEDLPTTHISLMWNDNQAFEDKAVVGETHKFGPCKSLRFIPAECPFFSLDWSFIIIGVSKECVVWKTSG